MRSLRSFGFAALGAALGLVMPAPPAEAELLRCKDAHGKTIYTDKPELCPGAKPFEPKGEIQAAPPRTAPASRGPSALERARERQRAYDAEAGEAKRWQRKKQESEQELARIRERREELAEFVTWCNRGNQVITRDKAGIKRTMSCKNIRKQYEDLDGDEARVQAYLDEGLAEECRRSGCLPGWIR